MKQEDSLRHSRRKGPRKGGCRKTNRMVKEGEENVKEKEAERGENIFQGTCKQMKLFDTNPV